MAKSAELKTGAYKKFRAAMKYMWQLVNAPCAICGQRTIKYDGEKGLPDSFELDHKISRKRCKAMGRPDLILAPSNAQPSHTRCNRAKSAGDATPSLGELDMAY